MSRKYGLTTAIPAAYLLSALQGCGGTGTSGRAMPDSDRTIQEVQEAHTREWMAVPGVVGTGIGACDGEPCIVVYASRMTDEIREKIPDEVEGYRVRVEVTGPFTPREPPPPAPPSGPSPASG